jgi:hypothetical protein
MVPDSAVDCNSMVRAGCTKEFYIQFFAGSDRLERRNTLLPVVDLYVVGYKRCLLNGEKLMR